MQSRIYFISGSILLLIGFIILLNSTQNLTGLAIMEDVDMNTGYVSSIWLIAAGILLFLIERQENYKNDYTTKHSREINYHGRDSRKENKRKRQEEEELAR